MTAWESVLVGFVPQDGDEPERDLSLVLGSVTDPAAACRHPDASSGYVASVPVGPGTHWPDVRSADDVVRHAAGIVRDAAMRLGAIVAVTHGEGSDGTALASAVTQGILAHLPVSDLMPVPRAAHANDDFVDDAGMAGTEADHAEVRLFFAMRAARESGPVMHRDLAARLARADAAVVRAIAAAPPGLPGWLPCPSFLTSMTSEPALGGRLVPTLVSYVLDPGRETRRSGTA